MKYHKINSLFKREEKSKQFTDEWSIPEFEMLKDIKWRFDEKVDGTNIRIMFNVTEGGSTDIEFRGRTDNAQLPPKLMDHLHNTFTVEVIKKVFVQGDNSVVSGVIFGEGYGAKIQKGGGDYRSDQGFILFDVNLYNTWLRRDSLEEIAEGLGVPITPTIGYGTIEEAIELCRSGFESKLRDSDPEGLILRPSIELCDRRGNRIISKLKLTDFP